MGKTYNSLLFFVAIYVVVAEHEDEVPQKSSTLINQKHPLQGSPSLQRKQHDFAHDLLDSTNNPLSISSTWRHNGRSFYLAHSAKDSTLSAQIGMGEEDMGEEVDENIPYNRGLPGQAMDDFRNELDEQVGSPASVLRSFMKHLSTIFMASVASFFAVVVAAMLYRIYKENPTSPPKDGEEHTAELLDQRRWRFGLGNCCANPSACFVTLCCPAVRWADTMHMAGLMSFWLALPICALLLYMGTASFGLTYLLFVLMATHGRQQIRALFDIPGPGRTAEGFAQDFCTYSCCCCCAIVQEAQQLEEAYAVGHPVVRLPPVDVEVPPPLKK